MSTPAQCQIATMWDRTDAGLKRATRNRANEFAGIGLPGDFSPRRVPAVNDLLALR